ncbi:MAG TPA: protein kinase [Gemmatimonadales bacterium]|jgi:serine/threonine-protein kinase|nr:protein kinase [Gemmatimonadales bacterium]
MSDISRLVTALADRYRIERELGQGGMATVYLAEDIKHSRKVAVKVLKPELAAVLGAERFLAEIKVTANLQHPNLLPLFDSGAADGFLYYVMPYVQGETLRARLERERQLPVDEVVRLVTLLANAMDYAHAQGVIHRDLKPDNILLQAGQPVIADFGIALAVAQAGGSRVTETGLSLGTPHYMSPEQAAGERTLDAKSDQYALGAVTYEMLSGEPPHTGPTAQAIIARLMTEKPRTLRATRPEVPPAIDLAVGRALAKSPADRFPSCGAFAKALIAGPAPRKRGWLIAAVVVGLALVAIAAWLVISKRSPASAPTAETAKSIAVLPLVNVGGDSTQEYFADGMAEELANALGKVPGLRVAARTSSFAFKGRQNLDVREVGEKLDVAVVLQGSVRRVGDRMRVSVQLIDANQRVELWSDSYNQPVKDAFAVQDSITQAIVNQLALKLGGAELAATLAERTSNPESHDLYLQGMSLVHEATEPAIRRALVYFRNALAGDSAYAQAYVGIAWAYAWLADAYQPSGIAYDSTRMAAEKAMQLGSQAGENYTLHGYASFVTDWDVAKAEREIQRGVALSPNSADAAVIYANFLCLTGRTDAGLAQADRAIELDRLSPWPGFVREWCLYLARRYDEVIAQHARTAALDQTFIYLDTFLGAAYREQGRYDLALAEYARAQGYMGEQPLHGYAITYARMGKLKEAREILGRLEAYARRHYVNPLFVAEVHASLGEKDLAFEWLERAVEDRTNLLAGLNTWPELESLHSDPRFAALGRRLGLPGSR